MKKVFLFSAVCAVALMTMAACNNRKNTKNAGNVAREYALNLQNRNYARFVDNMAFGKDVSQQDARNERAKYVRIMNEKIDPIVMGKGGIRDITIEDESINNDGDKATVKLRSHFNNGQTEDVTYDLMWVDGQWKIDMDKHRQVWKTTTADGRDVSFTLKDYDDKQVFKQNVDGDREVVKVKDEDDKQVMKVIENGERVVEKVKEKEDEVVMKEKVNGEKEVTRVKTE